MMKIGGMVEAVLVDEGGRGMIVMVGELMVEVGVVMAAAFTVTVILLFITHILTTVTTVVFY